MKNKVYLHLLIGIASIVIAYVFYYFISMDLINRFYPVSEGRGFVLYLCHVIFFYILIKLICSLKMYKFDKILSLCIYLCILYIALFDRFTLAERIMNVNPIQSVSEEGILQMGLNVLVFLPYYTMLTWFTHYPKKQKFMICIASILLVESLQYITMTGMFDIMDILLNMLGYLGGIKLYEYCFCAEHK